MKKQEKKVKEAAAIKYNPQDNAPKVVALGKGLDAENIIKVAEENKVPIYNDPETAHLLNLLQIGDEIPPELYEVIARILIFVSDLDRLKEEMGKSGRI